MRNSHDRSHAIKLALAFVAIYVIWGSTYLAIRYAVETIPPLVAAGIRHSIAGAIMLAWAWWRGFRPTRQQWVAGFVVGRTLLLDRARLTALGGAVCGVGAGGIADRD